MLLEKTQKNELYQRIVAGSLDPNTCTLANDATFVEITHKASGSWIVFDPTYEYNWRVRSIVADGPNKTHDGLDWPSVLDLTEDWAREINLPDFWSDLTQGQAAFANPQYDHIGNTLFTPGEQAEIATRLREIAHYVKKNYSLSGEQLALVEARFKEAEAASQRVGRKDWLLLFSGTLLTLITSDVLSPEIVQHTLMMALHSLGHLFGLPGPPPLQIPPMA